VDQPDYAARIHLCNWLLPNVHDGVVDPELLFITDEMWFNISGHVNTQNVEQWKYAMQQVLLHGKKVVWCAVSPRQIVGPLFFHETMNCGHYVSDILNPFFNRWIAEERPYGYFQQDSAAVY
jgi:hypothetical protein